MNTTIRKIAQSVRGGAIAAPILPLLAITPYSFAAPVPHSSPDPENAIMKRSAPETGVAYVDGQVIVRLRPGQAGSLSTLFDAKLFTIEKPLVEELELYLVKTGSRMSVMDAVSTLNRHPAVLYAQPDHVVSLRASTPNDPEFGRLWNFRNAETGADVRATAAWDVATGGTDFAGNDIVVAIVDGGMDTDHADLAENVWTNTGEIPGNGVDDDGNGYVDDVHGWNAYSNNGNIPMTADHGTHVGGIVGARGDNANQVTGVNWRVKLMAVAAASGSTSTISIGYGYVLRQKRLWLESGGKQGANVVVTNSSFGVDYADCRTGQYPVWNDLYNAMGEAGILSAAATINSDINVDQRGDVPTGCTSPYIVAVTNTDSRDQKAQAGYGATSIDLGAPGSRILSTISGGELSTMTGTSMATPHVAGAVALMHNAASESFYREYASSPASAALKLKELLLGSTDPIPALRGKTVTGGRLNLNGAVRAIRSYSGAPALR